jgi:hypothetical protein
MSCVVARREIVVSMYEGFVVVMAHNEKCLQTDVGDPDLWDSDSDALWAHNLSARLELKAEGTSQTMIYR